MQYISYLLHNLSKYSIQIKISECAMYLHVILNYKYSIHTALLKKNSLWKKFYVQQ